MLPEDTELLRQALTCCGVYTSQRPVTALRILSGKVISLYNQNNLLRAENAESRYYIALLMAENKRLNAENIRLAKEKACGNCSSRQATA